MTHNSPTGWEGHGEDVDVFITDAWICDGTGSSPQKGSVSVTGDRITGIYIGEAPTLQCTKIIRGEGKILAPGFVDVHSHSDYTVLAAPESLSKITQGITTEIVGNCGFSAFPLSGVLRDDEITAHSALGIEFSWTNAHEYFEQVEKAKPAVNIASYVGHRNLRGCVLGFEDRRPTHTELKAMIRLLAEAFEAGAIGISTGLIYIPGLFADSEELCALTLESAKRGGIYASHIRGEGDRLLQAAEEFFTIVDHTGTRAQYSHLKASGKRNWGKVDVVLAEIEKRLERGAHIGFDRYPYTASSTELSSLLPSWVVEGGRAAALRRLSDSSMRERIAQELEDDFRGEAPWHDILLADIPHESYRHYCGWSLAALAEELRMRPLDLFFELLVAGELEVWICHFTMSERDMDRVLSHPLCMVCTDAESRATQGVLAQGSPHPRAFGSFPQFIRRYVVEQKNMPIEEAIRKMTQLPAQAFQLKDRGQIALGYTADLVLFDLEAIGDPNEFGKPPRYATGVEMVMVNGVVEIENGVPTDARGGKVLRAQYR